MNTRKRICCIVALGLILGGMAHATALLALQARQARRLCDWSSEEWLALALIDGTLRFPGFIRVRPAEHPGVVNPMGDVDVPERDRLRYALSLLDDDRAFSRKGFILSCSGTDFLGPGSRHYEVHEALEWRLESLP